MQFGNLTAISPIDGRYSAKTSELQPLFSEYGLIHQRVLVEIRWLQALAANPDISEVPPLAKAAQEQLEQMIAQFSMADAQRVKAIESKTNHDVKAVEYFLKEKLAAHKALASLCEFVHFACTSEDINNLAYALILKNAREQCVLPQLDQLIVLLKQYAHDQAKTPMLAHTHGQAAVPTTLGKEIANFVARLQRQRQQIAAVQLMAKINGAVGNFNVHYCVYPEVDWRGHCQKFVEDLGLTHNAYTTQIEPHDSIVELCHAMIRCNHILVDYARDVWGYISLNYFSQRIVADEVGSSTMPHKVNPIDFEQAEGNLLIACSLFNHLANELPTSRWQRDLTDSTLLRNLGVAFAHSHLAWQALQKGTKKLQANRELMLQALDKHWDVLTEAVQTMMRRYGVANAYEQLKTLARGQSIDQSALHHFIDGLDLPEHAKKQLKQLQPKQYLGVSATLADEI
ncbi:MAG: adenylosuccinate lyase [Gammaproteobacteria bacterium]